MSHSQADEEREDYQSVTDQIDKLHEDFKHLDNIIEQGMYVKHDLKIQLEKMQKRIAYTIKMLK